MDTVSVPLSVVMPVHDEAGGLHAVLDDLAHFVLDAVPGSELIAVDDHSTDDTPHILADAARRDPRVRVVTNTVNAGHGPSVRCGLEASRGQWVLHCDSDGQVDLAEFPLLWEQTADHDLVLGIRRDRCDPRHRRLLSSATRLLASALAGHRVADANTPFRLVRRSLVDRLAPVVPPDAFAPAVLFVIGAHRCRARVAEVPVRHLPRAHGRSSLHPARLVRAVAVAGIQTVAFRFRRMPDRDG